MGPQIVAAAASQPAAAGGHPVRFNVNIRCVAFSPNTATLPPKHIYLVYSFYTFDEVSSPHLVRPSLMLYQLEFIYTSNIYVLSNGACC